MTTCSVVSASNYRTIGIKTRPVFLLSTGYRGIWRCKRCALKLRTVERKVFVLLLTVSNRPAGALAASFNVIRPALPVVRTLSTTFRSSLQLTSQQLTSQLLTQTVIKCHDNTALPCTTKSTPCIMMTLIFCLRGIGLYSHLIPNEDWLDRDAV